MADIRTVYIAEAEEGKDAYGLRIVKGSCSDKVRVEIVHTHYDGKAETTEEDILLPLETFSELIHEIWKGI